MNEKSNSNVENLVLILTLLFVFIMAARAPLDSDMWWHLRAGETTLENSSPLREDLFSHTRYGAHWVNHSWLSQIVMMILFQWQGFFGLGLFTIVMAVLTMGIVFIQMEGPPLLKSALIILGSLVAAVIWSPRPQMFSLLLMAAVLLVLHYYRILRKKILWIFIPLFILWSNLHAGYSLGLMLIGLTIGGECLNLLLSLDQEISLTWQEILELGVWGFAAGLVTLINPNGIDTWLVQFQTVNVESLQEFISEWASPDFHQITQQPFLWLLFLVFAAIGLSKKRAHFTELFYVIWFGYLSLVARRNFGPFAIVSLPLLSRYLWDVLQEWFNRLKSLANSNVKIKRLLEKLSREYEGEQKLVQKLINLSLVAVLAFVAFGKLYVVTQPSMMNGYLSMVYPVEAVSWLNEHRTGENLLNEYSWGGYLIWNLRDYPVFVDGRTDLYGDEVIQKWIQMIQAEGDWAADLDRYDIRYVMLEPSRPIIKLLGEQGWQLVYQDETVVLYERGEE